MRVAVTQQQLAQRGAVGLVTGAGLEGAQLPPGVERGAQRNGQAGPGAGCRQIAEPQIELSARSSRAASSAVAAAASAGPRLARCTAMLWR